MSFFDVPAPPPKPPPPEHVEPPWLSPPRGVIPGYSPQRATIFKTDRAILYVDRFMAYSTGVRFSLNLVLRKPNVNLHHMPWDLRGPRGPEPGSDDFVRFGIQFADGSKWTNIDDRMAHPLKRPAGPIVTHRASSGGDRSWRTDYWIWPLPADGPLTFVAAWPAYEVAESQATVDGTELRQCAEAAEVIWPG